MKVLLNITDKSYETEIGGALSTLGIQAYLSETRIDSTDADSTKKLLEEIMQASPDMVLTTNYYPLMSIVCKTLNVKYAAWIVADYDANLYSCTLLNECNYVFIADYALFEEFSENGFERVYYLPLGAFEACFSWNNENQKEYLYDLAMLQRTVTREEMGEMPLSAGSPLKDATKGYLEGCIACQYQIRGIPSIASHLPTYVWEDLEKYFPTQITTDSVESAKQYYDSRYFNPLITCAERDIFYHTLQENKYFEHTVLKNDYSLEELTTIAARSKINLVIAHRNIHSGIPQNAWNILGSGGFLLGNEQEDYHKLFDDCEPILFNNARTMLSRGIYYLNHNEERECLARTLRSIVSEKHRIGNRIKRIIEGVDE